MIVIVLYGEILIFPPFVCVPESFLVSDSV